MQNFSISLKEMAASFWRNRWLIKALATREVVGRYRGSILGVLWSFFNPLFMLIVYTFVFSVVFKARWNVDSESKSEFALILFAGLIVYNLFAECINRAPNLIISNANYVKKVIFPLEIMPWVSLCSALFHVLISLIVWLCAYVLLFGLPKLTILYFPLIIIPLIFMIMGLSWVLISLGVYLRDVSQFTAIFTTVLLFLSPIFYPINAIPEKFRNFLYINPLTQVVEQTRAVLYYGNHPDARLLLYYQIVAFLIAWLGFAWFQKTRKGFADVV
jgi:lipopolysaccharide transport system permease protein